MSIAPAAVTGVITPGGTNAYIGGLDIVLGTSGAAAVAKDEIWTVTINGKVYSSGKAKASDKVDDVAGKLLAEIKKDFMASTYDAANHKIVFVAGSPATVFTLTRSTGATASTLAAFTSDITRYNGSAVVAITGTPYEGQVWTLTVNDGTATPRVYTYTALATDTTADKIAIGLKGRVDAKSTGAGKYQYTATKTVAGQFAITNSNGTAFSVGPVSVAVAPVDGTISVDIATSTASHYHPAELTLAGPVTPDETWRIELTKRDDPTNPIIILVKASDDTIASLGAAFVAAINTAAPGIFTPSFSGSKLTINYAAGVKVVELLPRVVAPVEGSAAFNGTPVARWEQTITFNGGGPSGATSLNDVWTLKFDGESFTQNSSDLLFSTVATDFSNQSAIKNLAGYDFDTPVGNSLTFRRADGELVSVVEVGQTRDRTAELLAKLSTSLILDDQRPHYTKVETDFKSTLSVGAGDIWSVTLNGHTFKYVSKGKDTLKKVVRSLVAEINKYSNVYSASVKGDGRTHD